VRPEGGESWRDVYERAAGFVERLRAETSSLTDLPNAPSAGGEPFVRRANHAPLQSAPPGGSPRRELILVTHGGTLNMICAYLEGIPVEALEWQRFENCAVKTIVLDSESTTR
jgi:broad specificity phosphatase PhoE